jgi:CBS domain-containing protein
MSDSNVEQIYVVDDESRPVGVVTAIELLNVLSQPDTDLTSD